MAGWCGPSFVAVLCQFLRSVKNQNRNRGSTATTPVPFSDQWVGLRVEWYYIVEGKPKYGIVNERKRKTAALVGHH